MQSLSTCPTGKIVYATGRLASLAHRGVRGSRRACHPYRCEHCAGWHLGRGNGHLARTRAKLDTRLEQLIDRHPGICPEDAAPLLGVSLWEAVASAERLLRAGRIGPAQEHA